MSAETTSFIGMRIACVRGRFPLASCLREAPGGAALRKDSTAVSALIANAAP